MSKFDSITHFLQSGGFNYRIYDMGRKINLFNNDEFEKIEKQGGVYPYPLQKKAWLALLFWQDQKGNAKKSNKDNKTEPVIWFLQFPIDELGFLKQEARDSFLIDLLEQAGKNIQAKQKGEIGIDELNESPFAFKPNPDRLAMFHALATKELGNAPSQYYQHTRDYLSGDAGYEQWQFLGLQGIADVVARLNEDNNESLLAKAVGLMPEMPLVSFCSALENSRPKKILTLALIDQINKEIDIGANNQLLAMLVRALSGAEPETLRRETIQLVLDSSLGKDIEVMVAISGRAWMDLYSDSLVEVFVDNLAELDEMAFNAILSDLMMIPEMRKQLLRVMHDPQRSTMKRVNLTDKLDQFLSSFSASL